MSCYDSKIIGVNLHTFGYWEILQSLKEYTVCYDKFDHELQMYKTSENKNILCEKTSFQFIDILACNGLTGNQPLIC